MNAARIHLDPELPQDFPFRALVMKTVYRISRERTWQAYQAGIVGREVAEAVLKAAFFDAVNAQDKDTFGPDVRGQMLDAFEQAFNMCVPE